MEQMTLKMKQILPIDKNVKQLAKKEARHDKDEFKKVLTSKINENSNKSKIVNKNEARLNNKKTNINEDMDNSNVDIELLKSILNALNISVDENFFEELKTIKNYEEALQKINELLSLKGFSENDIKKLFTMIEEIKKEQFSDLKNRNLENIDKSLRNLENIQKINDKKEVLTKFQAFEKLLAENHGKEGNKVVEIEKFFHDILKSKEENKPVIRNIKIDLVQSTNFSNDKHNVVNTDSHTVKVEKSSDVLKFVDYIKLANIKDGQKLVVKLHPAHLGNLKIELSEIAGKMTAKLLVDSHEAKHLLMTNIDAIKQQLETKGIILADVELGYLHDDNNQGRFERENNGSFGKPHGRESFKIEEVENTKENDSAIYA